MALRSGLDAQIGFAEETTWGTYQTVTRFLANTAESLELTIDRIDSAELRAYNRVLRYDRFAANRKGVAGTIDFELADRGFGLLLKHCLGAVAITTPSGATLTRDHTHTLGDTYGLSLTIQKGVPDVGGTVRPLTYLGCKVSEWTISNAVDGLLLLSMTVDGQDETQAESLETASYPATQALLHFGQGAITIAGTQYDLSDFSLSGSMGLATERYFIRSSTLKKEQFPAAMVELSGEMTGEFEDLTAYNRFVNGTTAAVVATWTGTTIEGAFDYYLEITLPAVRFDGTTPQVGGPDIVSQPLPFRVLDNGTDEPITIVYRTTDTVS